MPDPLALTMLKAQDSRPALSATSDIPAVAEPSPTPTPTTSPVETTEKPAVDSKPAAPQGETAEDPAPSDDHSGDDPAANAEAGHKPAKGVQKRIDELTRQRGEAERLASEQSKRLDKALELIERLSGKPANEARAEVRQDDPRPARDQFDDPDHYVEALSEWSGRRAVQAYQIEQQQANQRTTQEQKFEKVLTEWEKGKTKAVEKYPDWQEVTTNQDVQIAPHVGLAILNNPHGHDIAYYLGQNPQEAARISALDAPFVAAMEVGALGYKLSSQAAQVSKAPAPVKPIGTRNSAESLSPEEDPNYMEKRLAEMRARKQPS